MALPQKNDTNRTWLVLYLTLFGLYLLLTVYLAGLSLQQPEAWNTLKLRWFAWVMASFFSLVWLLALGGQLGEPGAAVRRFSVWLGQGYARFCLRWGWLLLLAWSIGLLGTWWLNPQALFVPPLLGLALAGLLSYRWPGRVWERLLLINGSLVWGYFALVWFLWP